MMRMISQDIMTDDFDYLETIEGKIIKEKHNLSKKALERFDKECVSLQDSACTLLEVRNELIARGVGESCLKHSLDDFSDKLEITINDIAYNLEIPCFPKRKSGRAIGLTTGLPGLRHHFGITSSPAGIAQFIIALTEWMPEYLSIEERITSEEKKKKIACDMALDLVKKMCDNILTPKGYQHDIKSYFGSNVAMLRINFDKALTMTLRIDLLEDFLDQLIRVIESLPDIKNEQASLRSLENILHCIMIENFDSDLVKHLREGGYNVIVHEGRIWVPNMSLSTLKDSQEAKVYTKLDALPQNAPIAALKEVNAKLGELLLGLSKAEKEEFLQRLVNGVGFAGYYNRHRYKVLNKI